MNANLQKPLTGKPDPDQMLVMLNERESILLTCVKCGQGYRAGSIDSLLHRCCLCGEDLES